MSNYENKRKIEFLEKGKTNKKIKIIALLVLIIIFVVLYFISVHLEYLSAE